MFKKGTKLYSITKGKCPRCQKGGFFKNKISYHLSKTTEIHSNCPNCNLKYMIEPSFFYGAMYVNYGITVALSVAVFIISAVIFELSLLQSFLSIFLVLIILAPLNLRLSRILWINMFISYDEKFIKKK